MKSVLLTAGAALALLATPVTLAAQEAAVEEPQAAGAETPDVAQDAMADISQIFSGLFNAEPLTPQQEARVPAAAQLVAKIIPEGTMGEMVDKIIGGVLQPMMAAAPEAKITLAKQIGTEAYAIDLTDEQASELASLFDPAWAERHQREAAMFPAMMKEVVALMEPGMRKAMSELYAIRFSTDELAEIDAFFSTGTGAKYARESFLMASDPRIMASSMEAMPALMGSIGDMEKRMAESMADLPAVRSFADLSPEERAKVAEMTGFTPEEIDANLASFDYEDEAAFATVEEIMEDVAVEAESADNADLAAEAAELE